MNAGGPRRVNCEVTRAQHSIATFAQENVGSVRRISVRRDRNDGTRRTLGLLLDSLFVSKFEIFKRTKELGS